MKTIVLNLGDLAKAVHAATNLCHSLGEVPSEFASLFATWDTLLGNPMRDTPKDDLLTVMRSIDEQCHFVMDDPDNTEFEVRVR